MTFDLFTFASVPEIGNQWWKNDRNYCFIDEAYKKLHDEAYKKLHDEAFIQACVRLEYHTWSHIAS